MISGRLSNARNTIRSLGAVDAFVFALHRVVNLLSLRSLSIQRFYLFAQPLVKVPQLSKRRGGAITVSLCTDADRLVNELPRPRQELEARLQAGSTCYIAEVDDVIAGCMWLHRGRYFEEELGVVVRCEPLDACVWDYDVFVLPEHRGGFVFPKLWSEVAQRLMAEGVTHSVSLAYAHNDASIRSHCRMGSFAIGSGLLLAMGRRAITVSGGRLLPRRDEARAAELVADASHSRHESYRRFRRS